MSSLTILLLGLLGVLVMSANRDAGSDARTIADILADVRATGWRAALYAVGGIVVVIALVAGAASGLALNIAAKAAYALAMALAALAWHLRTLSTPPSHHEPFAMPAGEMT